MTAGLFGSTVDKEAGADEDSRPVVRLDEWTMALLDAPGEGEAGQNFGPFFLYGQQCAGIVPESLQNCRSHLASLDRTSEEFGREAGVGDDQQDIAVIDGEATMFENFLRAPGVNHTHIGRDDQVLREG